MFCNIEFLNKERAFKGNSKVKFNISFDLMIPPPTIFNDFPTPDFRATS